MSGGLTEKGNLETAALVPSLSEVDTCHSSAIHTTLGPATRSLPANFLV